MLWWGGAIGIAHHSSAQFGVAADCPRALALKEELTELVGGRLCFAGGSWWLGDRRGLVSCLN